MRSPKSLLQDRFDQAVSLRGLAVLLLAFVTVAATLTVATIRPSSAVTAGDTFVPLTSFRLVDTTTGVGGSTTALGAGSARTYQVAGTGAIPASGVRAVVVDVAVKSTTSSTPSSLRIWEAGTTMPSEASVVRFDSTNLGSNTAIVPLSSDGKFSVWNNTGSTHFNIDVQGYFTPATSPANGGFTALSPVRVYDGNSTTLSQNVDYEAQVTGSEIPEDATAVFANVKVYTPSSATSGGGLKVGPGGTDLSSRPTSVDFPAGGYADSGMLIKLSADGKIRLRSSAPTGSAVQAYVDVQGYFTGDGSGFTPLAQGVIYDTNDSTTLAAGTERTITVAGNGGVPSNGDADSVAMSIYVSSWTGPGRLIAYNPDDEAAPTSSNVSFNDASMSSSTGASSTAVVQLSVDGKVRLKYVGAGSLRIRLNAQGWFAAPVQQVDSPDLSGLDVPVQTVDTAASPKSLTFTPQTTGTSLSASGSAQVTISESSTALGTYTMTATDSSNASVPVSASVSGNSMIATVTPTSSTAYPIVVRADLEVADLESIGVGNYRVYPSSVDPGPSNPYYKAGCKSKAFTQKYKAGGVTFYGLNYSVKWCWTSGYWNSIKNKKISGSTDPWANGPYQVSNDSGPTNSARVPIDIGWVDSDGTTNVYYWFQSRGCATGPLDQGCTKWVWHKMHLRLYAGGRYELVSRS